MIPLQKNAVCLKVLLKKCKWSSVEDKYGIFMKEKTNKDATQKYKCLRLQLLVISLFESLRIQ